MSAILLTHDMLISSQATTVAKARGWSLTTVGSLAALIPRLRSTRPNVVLVDLGLPGLEVSRVVGAVHEAEDCPAAVIAFGPHVQQAKLTAAAAAGCDQVLARGQLSRRLEEILQPYFAPTRPSDDTQPSSD
jgi:CheY-like chemotaxis protein